MGRRSEAEVSQRRPTTAVPWPSGIASGRQREVFRPSAPPVHSRKNARVRRKRNWMGRVRDVLPAPGAFHRAAEETVCTEHLRLATRAPRHAREGVAAYVEETWASSPRDGDPVPARSRSPGWPPGPSASAGALAGKANHPGATKATPLREVPASSEDSGGPRNLGTASAPKARAQRAKRAKSNSWLPGSATAPEATRSTPPASPPAKRAEGARSERSERSRKVGLSAPRPPSRPAFDPAGPAHGKARRRLARSER